LPEQPVAESAVAGEAGVVPADEEAGVSEEAVLSGAGLGQRGLRAFEVAKTPTGVPGERLFLGEAGGEPGAGDRGRVGGCGVGLLHQPQRGARVAAGEALRDGGADQAE